MIAWLLACGPADDVAPVVAAPPIGVPLSPPSPPPPPPPPRPPRPPAEPEPAAVPVAGPPPDGLVDLRSIPELRFDIRYATSDNFTGAPLPGYGAAGAWMTPAAAAALGAVAVDLADEGVGLLVHDAYRPVRATKAMVAWTERVDRRDLITDGYIAARSGHNKGHTVDLTLVDAEGTPLDMGTPWDTFSTASHTEQATGQALANRHQLRDAMVAGGFRPYSKEWWHFGYPDPTARPLDVPYAADQAGSAGVDGDRR